MAVTLSLSGLLPLIARDGKPMVLLLTAAPNRMVGGPLLVALDE